MLIIQNVVIKTKKKQKEKEKNNLSESKNKIFPELKMNSLITLN